MANLVLASQSPAPASVLAEVALAPRTAPVASEVVAYSEWEVALAPAEIVVVVVVAETL